METLEQSQQRFAGTEAGKMDAATDANTASVHLPEATSPHPLITWTPEARDLIEKHSKLRIYITAHEPTRNMVLAECDVSLVGAMWLKLQMGEVTAFEFLTVGIAQLAELAKQKEAQPA